MPGGDSEWTRRKLTTLMGRLDLFTLAILLAFAVLAGGCGSAGGLTGIPVGDTVTPSVTSTTPASDATVPADSQISVTFNKPMNTRSVTISSDPKIALTSGEWSTDERTVVFKPQAPASAGTRYTITIAAQDKSGHAMPPFAWSFTAAAPSARSGSGSARLKDRLEARSDARLFTLFAALNAVGYDAGASEAGPVRAALRSAAGEIPLKTVEPFRKFWAEHPRPLDAYVRYVLSLSDPPEFAERRAPDGFERLNRILADFYVGAKVGEWWTQHQEAHKAASAALAKEGPVVIGQVLDYLRSVELPAERFVLIPNLLDDPDAAYAVREPQAVLLVVGSRAAEDPLSLTGLAARLLLGSTTPEVAAQLRRTETLYSLVKDQVLRDGHATWESVVRESLVVAVTARLALPVERREAYLRPRYAKGLILVNYFNRELPRYERAAVPLSEFLPELLRTVDLDEEKRLYSSRTP